MLWLQHLSFVRVVALSLIQWCLANTITLNCFFCNYFSIRVQIHRWVIYFRHVVNSLNYLFNCYQSLEYNDFDSWTLTLFPEKKSLLVVQLAVSFISVTFVIVVMITKKQVLRHSVTAASMDVLYTGLVELLIKNMQQLSDVILTFSRYVVLASISTVSMYSVHGKLRITSIKEMQKCQLHVHCMSIIHLLWILVTKHI